MKTIVLTVALLGSVCLGGQPAIPAALPGPEDTVSPAVGDEAIGSVQDAKRVAERAMEQAQRAMQFAKSKFAMADAGEGGDTVDFQGIIDNGIGYAINSPGRSASPPVIVRSGEIDPKALSNIQEDLTVMSRILTKTVEREQGRDRESAMGIVLSALPGSRRPQSIFLEGYGALFLMNVKFPLIAPASKEDEKSDKTADTTWEQTKRELYVTGDKEGKVKIWDLHNSEAGVEYSAEQVESLKKELVEALKNATNIREVKSNEFISVAVFGSRAAGPATHVKRLSRNTGNVRRSEVYAVTDGNRQSGHESTMSIRAKKEDVDAFAKGDLDLEQFKKRVSIAVY